MEFGDGFAAASSYRCAAARSIKPRWLLPSGVTRSMNSGGQVSPRDLHLQHLVRIERREIVEENFSRA